MDWARFEALGYITIIALLVTWMAWKLGFYQSISKPTHLTSKVSFQNVLSIFLIFICVEVIIAPNIFKGWMALVNEPIDLKALKINVLAQGWMNLVVIGLTAVAMAAYCFFLKKTIRTAIWGQNAFKSFLNGLKDFSLGSLTWLITFPLIIWIGQAINMALPYIYQGPHADQVAVKHLKATFTDPLLFWLTVIAIIFIVPILEELIFRGFLQTWLKGFLGKTKAIIFASILFALFHFSFQQKIDNIELLLSLFVLSFYLGFLFERQQSLWAPIGLHSTFNGISILMIAKGLS